MKRKSSTNSHAAITLVLSLRRYKLVILALFVLLTFFVYRHFSPKLSSIPTLHWQEKRFTNLFSSQTDNCTNIEKIDPFSPEIMKYMTDFGDSNCSNDNEIGLSFKQGNNVSFSGFDINAISFKEITKDNESFNLSEPINYFKPKVNVVMRRGHSAGLQVMAPSLRCVVPAEYEEKSPPEEIPLIFTSNCKQNKKAFFTFTKEGVIRHNKTGKCIGPKGDVVKNEVPLVLVDSCHNTFDVIESGVLQHSSKFCIHPLGGSKDPNEGQKLCLYDHCKPEKRLQYQFTEVLKSTKELGKIEEKLVTIKKELNLVEVATTNSKRFVTFVGSVQKKNVPSAVNDVTSPNVYVITFDELSDAHFKRKLPLSQAYLSSEMKTSEYNVYGSISMSTRENVFAVMSGIGELDKLTTSSIFSTARKHKYVSLFMGDFPYEGFSSIDSDHNATPLYLAMKRYYDVVASKYCLLNQTLDSISFNYLTSFMHAYQKTPKLAVSVFTEMTQKNYNTIGYVDKTLRNFLANLRDKKRTILILNSIKGTLSGELGKSQQGTSEYRNPLLKVYVSDDLKNTVKLDDKRRNELSSPYDLYVTISELLSGAKVQHHFGKSLCESIPHRECTNAGIASTMCPC